MAEAKRSRWRRIAGIVAVFVVLSIAALAGLFFSVQEKRVRLLCRTDHHALLQACQELSRQVAAGELRPGRYRMRGGQKDRTLKLSQVIRELRPTVITVDPTGRVVVSMAAGLSGFGACAYPDGFQEPSVGYDYGDRELIPNLWYFDIEYQRDPDYDKVVDSIMRQHKSNGQTD